MILIAKGKFSQPRKPRRDHENIPEYIPPIQEPAPQPERDSSLDETMLLTGVFDPIREEAPAAAAPAAPVPQDTITFEEAEFIQ